MTAFFYIKLLSLITIAVIAVPFLVVAIRGFKTRRPFLFSLRWVSLTILVWAVSLMLTAVIVFFSVTSSSPSFSMISSALLLSVCATLVGVCSVLIGCMKGYAAFGTPYAQFREALMATLEELELSYEEPLSKRRPTSLLSKRHIKLTSIEADLQISTWLGAVHIAVKQAKKYPLLTEISSRMNRRFDVSSLRPSLIPYAFYLLAALGVLTAAMASVTVLFPKIL